MPRLYTHVLLLNLFFSRKRWVGELACSPGTTVCSVSSWITSWGTVHKKLKLNTQITVLFAKFPVVSMTLNFYSQCIIMSLHSFLMSTCIVFILKLKPAFTNCLSCEAMRYIMYSLTPRLFRCNGMCKWQKTWPLSAIFSLPFPFLQFGRPEVRLMYQAHD